MGGEECHNVVGCEFIPEDHLDVHEKRSEGVANLSGRESRRECFDSVGVIHISKQGQTCIDDLHKDFHRSLVIMSSTEQATSSNSNFRLIVDALADYVKLTGIDISNSPFAQSLALSNSPQAILELLEEREKAFKEYRDRNRRLISSISPVVEVIHAFSGTLSQLVSLVSNTYYGLLPRHLPS